MYTVIPIQKYPNRKGGTQIVAHMKESRGLFSNLQHWGSHRDHIQKVDTRHQYKDNDYEAWLSRRVE